MERALKKNENIQTMVTLDETRVRQIIDIAWKEDVPAGQEIIVQGLPLLILLIDREREKACKRRPLRGLLLHLPKWKVRDLCGQRAEVGADRHQWRQLRRARAALPGAQGGHRGGHRSLLRVGH